MKYWKDTCRQGVETDMKIVHINCVFGEGSTGKIVEAIYHFATTLGDESYVIYGMGDKHCDPHLIRTIPKLVRKIQSVRSRITGYPYGGCIWGTYVALKALKRIKPDIVHLHCANAYMVNIYRLLEYLKKESIPTVITNHAEFMYTGGCTHSVDCNKWLTGCYDCKKIGKEHPISYLFDRTKREWQLMRNAYNGFENLTICCVSDWVRERACQSPFYQGHPVITVLNGLDTGVFHYTNPIAIRKKLNLGANRVVIHVTPHFNSPIKGGKHVIEMAKRRPEVQFVIVGDYSDISTAPSNCHFAGRITDQEKLATYYSLADVCLLTSLRETFSMVCAESLCCGTPIVGFKSGAPELISLPEYSKFVDQDDDDALIDALNECLNNHVDKLCLSAYAVKRYGQERMCKEYYKVYQEAMKNNEDRHINTLLSES